MKLLDFAIHRTRLGPIQPAVLRQFFDVFLLFYHVSREFIVKVNSRRSLTGLTGIPNYDRRIWKCHWSAAFLSSSVSDPCRISLVILLGILGCLPFLVWSCAPWFLGSWTASRTPRNASLSRLASGSMFPSISSSIMDFVISYWDNRNGSKCFAFGIYFWTVFVFSTLIHCLWCGDNDCELSGMRWIHRGSELNGIEHAFFAFYYATSNNCVQWCRRWDEHKYRRTRKPPMPHCLRPRGPLPTFLGGGWDNLCLRVWVHSSHDCNCRYQTYYL